MLNNKFKKIYIERYLWWLFGLKFGGVDVTNDTNNYISSSTDLKVMNIKKLVAY